MKTSVCRRDSLFIVDPTDIAKPYAKKMENIALVRDGDKGQLVTGYWCFEAYVLDKDKIIWPVLLWLYSLEAEGQLSENEQRINDHLRYCREPKGFWFYRLFIALSDAFLRRATMSLSAWCKPPQSPWPRNTTSENALLRDNCAGCASNPADSVYCELASSP